MMEEKKNDVLYAKMLEGFSAEYNGVELIDQRQLRAQFSQLMELLLFHRDAGVSRAVLQEVLFEDRAIDDVQHAIRNILYNLRKRLRGLGLPETDYVVVDQGVYYWTKKIPVVLDTDEFLALKEAAEWEEDPEKRMALLRRAVELYRSGFLGRQNTNAWAVQQFREFQEAFAWCVETMARHLREKKDFREMKILGELAVKADPYCEWERLIVEALSALGYYEEARNLCNDTVNNYIKEFGRSSTSYIRELMNQLSSVLVHEHEDLGMVQSRLLEEEESRRGGYFCTYPAFQDVYRVLARTMDRNRDRVFLMLCTIVDGKGNPMKEGPKLNELSDRLSEAIVGSVRNSDTVTRYGMGQFLVLLLNTTRENCRVVEERISRNFHRGRERVGVDYDVRNVILSSILRDGWKGE